MKILSLVLVTLLLAVTAAAQEKPLVLDVDVEVVSVDLDARQMTFRDGTDTPYVGKVDKNTKLKAKKKVFSGKLQLKDFQKGDKAKVKLLPAESRLLEVRLVERAPTS